MNCKNCNTSLVNESEYCNICGGKVIKKRLTLRNLAQHLGETFLIMTTSCLKQLST